MFLQIKKYIKIVDYGSLIQRICKIIFIRISIIAKNRADYQEQVIEIYQCRAIFYPNELLQKVIHRLIVKRDVA
jgi:hypothetical protein